MSKPDAMSEFVTLLTESAPTFNAWLFNKKAEIAENERLERERIEEERLKIEKERQERERKERERQERIRLQEQERVRVQFTARRSAFWTFHAHRHTATPDAASVFFPFFFYPTS